MAFDILVKFSRTLAIILAWAFLIQACTNNEENAPIDSYARELLLLDTAFSIDYLHHIKIGEIKQAERSLEDRLAINAKIMRQYIALPETPVKEKDAIYGRLRLLSVFNEKYPVERWTEDKELMEIFAEAQSQDMEDTEQLRCLNWSQPMWEGADVCPRNK